MAMTIKQKQWQLYFLGYYSGPYDPGTPLEKIIDGIWGEKSQAATLAFQRDFFEEKIAHDGDFGTSTQGKSREVIDAIQDVITSYAAKPLVNDGLAGPATMAATEAYQQAQGLPVTGIADSETYNHIKAHSDPLPDVNGSNTGDRAEDTNATETDDWRNEIEFFEVPEEFGCKCGGQYCNGYPAQMQEQVVRICDAARRHFGRPGHVISGLRCPEWNRIQGGVANSQHMYGEAVDLYIEGVTADQLLAFIQTQPHRYAYKINGTNVHVDIPKGKR